MRQWGFVVKGKVHLAWLVDTQASGAAGPRPPQAVAPERAASHYGPCGKLIPLALSQQRACSDGAMPILHLAMHDPIRLSSVRRGAGC
jgi:hypothetical protein